MGEDWSTRSMPPQPPALVMSPPPLGSPFVLKETVRVIKHISPLPVSNYMLLFPWFYPPTDHAHRIRNQLYCDGHQCMFKPSRIFILQRKYVLPKKMGGNAPGIPFTPVYYGTIFFGMVVVANTYTPSSRSIPWSLPLILVTQPKQTVSLEV